MGSYKDMLIEREQEAGIKSHLLEYLANYEESVLSDFEDKIRDHLVEYYQDQEFEELTGSGYWEIGDTFVTITNINLNIESLDLLTLDNENNEFSCCLSIDYDLDYFLTFHAYDCVDKEYFNLASTQKHYSFYDEEVECNFEHQYSLNNYGMVDIDEISNIDVTYINYPDLELSLNVFVDLIESEGLQEQEDAVLKDQKDEVSEEHEVVQEKEDHQVDSCLFNQYFPVVKNDEKFIGLYNILGERISELKKLLAQDNTCSNQTILIMSHGHLIAALEGFLENIFVGYVSTYDKISKAFVRTIGTELPNYSLKDIVCSPKEPREYLISYLRGFSFHNTKYLKNFFSVAFDINLSDEESNWLGKAVQARHDCVHRAGYSQEGKLVEVNADKLNQLINNIEQLVEKIYLGINKSLKEKYSYEIS